VKRALIALLIVAGIPFASVACSDDAADQKTLKPATEKDNNEPSDNDSDRSSSSSTITTPPAQTTSTIDAGPAPNTQSCSATTSALECAQCCVMRNNPLVGCACNVGSQCQAACGQNFCAGGLPDIQCGLCLFQARCQIDLSEFSGGAENSQTRGAIESCVQQSACQAKGGNLPGGNGNGFGNFGFGDDRP
jgi:hypothetical protein